MDEGSVYRDSRWRLPSDAVRFGAERGRDPGRFEAMERALRDLLRVADEAAPQLESTRQVFADELGRLVHRGLSSLAVLQAADWLGTAHDLWYAAGDEERVALRERLPPDLVSLAEEIGESEYIRIPLLEKFVVQILHKLGYQTAVLAAEEVAQELPLAIFQRVDRVQLLRRAALINLVSTLEAGLLHAAHRLCALQPSRLAASGRTFSASEVTKAGSHEALLEILATDLLNRLERKGVRALLQFVGIQGSGPLDLQFLTELVERRNVHVHHDGYVSQQYLELAPDSDVALGDYLRLESDYMRTALEQTKQVRWRIATVLRPYDYPSAHSTGEAEGQSAVGG